MPESGDVGREFTPKTHLPPDGVADDYARGFHPLIFFLTVDYFYDAPPQKKVKHKIASRHSRYG